MTTYIVIPFHSETSPQMRRMVNFTRNLFPKAKLYCVKDKLSQGKGWTLRTGFEQALNASKSDDDLFAYIDGDFDINPIELKTLFAHLNGYDIAVGKKKLSGLITRRFISFYSRMYIKLLFNLNVDTQTGIKVYKKKAVFLTQENGFLCDVAMLYAAKRNGCTMVQIPVTANIKKRVPISALMRTFKESIGLFFRIA